ncbi:threonine ammonia-lyase [Massilimicrobiota timonensis]|uniref:L-threonine dehydratase catabolic TdcB n=1 Tax=Massilimicrobiota timonensis TaxID=1776392 RepID=A0A1Y4SXJ7_9FIRM|nr:threonine ammonia-lyase [Massilimicrobiota timonensis]MBM6967133.1 threonine ammonia-lyase [Massilimicrobiota timonensis]OUQ33662.1 threonine ammonia-lyase [Massilimicrobiota timonensis]
MLDLKHFQEAKKRVDEVIIPTPLIYSEAFSKECKNQVYIKPENLQRTGAFKIRGAYNKIMKMDDESKSKGLIASSAGNHAQGVAYAASKLGVKAVIVMPKHTPLIKVEATEAHGAEVVLAGEVYDEAYQKACDLQKEYGYTFVHPFNDEDVIEGQGTIALEILDELPDTDIILVPIGGGGLISGIACAAKQIKPTIKIIGVEPEGAASALAAINEDQVVALKEANTIADGTAVKEIGDMTFDYIKEYVDGIITVSDYELMDAFLLLVEKHKLVAENSGILSLAALKKLNEKNKKVVSLISGGNIDVLTISSMINKGLIARGRIFTFTVQLLDKPGELEYVSHVLSQCNANVIGVEHNQFKNFARFSEVELRVTCETNGEKHIQRIIDTFAKEGYEITRIN